jgi:thiamine biosynthesis lipoprotein
VIRVDARFPSMGAEARVVLESHSHTRDELEGHAAAVREAFELVEGVLSRFRGDSELSVLNADPRTLVPASPVMRRFVAAARWAAVRSCGLVDATLVEPLERQGYARSRAGLAPADLHEALQAAPARRPARPRPSWAFRCPRLEGEGRVRRPAGVRVDSGGLGKGLAADLAASRLPAGVRFALGVGGDLAVGGAWDVAVTGPGGAEVHRLPVPGGGVATSGIHSRLWRRPDGSFAHHLLDPASGEPAWTGLVAATAVAPTALEAEVVAKTALLRGPQGARDVLRLRGGVLQHEDGTIEPVPGATRLRVRPLEAVA